MAKRNDIHHGRDHHSSYSGYCTRGGTRNSCKEGTKQHRNDTKSAVDIAHQAGSKVHQPLGQSARLHQVSG